MMLSTANHPTNAKRKMHRRKEAGVLKRAALQVTAQKLFVVGIRAVGHWEGALGILLEIPPGSLHKRRRVCSAELAQVPHNAGAMSPLC